VIVAAEEYEAAEVPEVEPGLLDARVRRWTDLDTPQALGERRDRRVVDVGGRQTSVSTSGRRAESVCSQVSAVNLIALVIDRSARTPQAVGSASDAGRNCRVRMTGRGDVGSVWWRCDRG
jgi:hypothetical protein